MKPRLDTVPLTDEDFNIFAYGYRDCPIPPGLPDLTKVPDGTPRPFYRGLVWGSSNYSDKRDAEIMHALGHHTYSCGVCKAWVGVYVDVACAWLGQKRELLA